MPQWIFRSLCGASWGVEVEGLLTDGSSQQGPLALEAPTTLAFNSGAQYMEEIRDPLEAQIVHKEVSILIEYEAHRGRPLASNPLFAMCIILAEDIQVKLQLAQGI